MGVVLKRATTKSGLANDAVALVAAAAVVVDGAPRKGRAKKHGRAKTEKDEAHAANATASARVRSGPSVRNGMMNSTIWPWTTTSVA